MTQAQEEKIKINVTHKEWNAMIQHTRRATIEELEQFIPDCSSYWNEYKLDQLKRGEERVIAYRDHPNRNFVVKKLKRGED